MINYIRLNSGNLYAYNENGITIVYNGDSWKPSKLNYVAILYSDRTDYIEMNENEVEEKYGKEIVLGSKHAFEKIDKLINPRK